MQSRCAWMLPLLLSSCAVLKTPVGQEVELLIYPKFSMASQAILNPNTLASIATLDIVPYQEVASGSYSPISLVTGNPTTYGAADMLKLSQASPSIDPNRPFIIRKLKPLKNYRLWARAYNSSNAVISLDANSYTDILVSNNDAPSMANLPVILVNTPFGATTSVYFNVDGRYEFLKGSLYLGAGTMPIGVIQTTRNAPTLAFSNLQGNTTYRLVAEAYKLGAMLASSSLTLNITNDTAPTTATMDLTVPYVMTTLAGNGTASFADGTGSQAMFNLPCEVSADSLGNIYVGDHLNNRIRKVTPAGVVTTVAGNGTPGFADGPAASAQFNGSAGVTVDPAGNVYVADNMNHRIRKIAAGTVTTVAGNGVGDFADGIGTSSMVKSPYGLFSDAQGVVYIGDYGNQRIRKIVSSGMVSTVAGSSASGFADGPAASAKFNCPVGLCADSYGNLYVADSFNNRIRKIAPDGTVSTLAGKGSIGFADGPATSAMLSSPRGVTVDPQGNIYAVDSSNNAIRKINPQGMVTTIAGNGSAGFADGTGTAALLFGPYGITIDPQGILYVGDERNYRIRKLQ